MFRRSGGSMVMVRFPFAAQYGRLPGGWQPRTGRNAADHDAGVSFDAVWGVGRDDVGRGARLDPARTVAMLPVGAIEAHGPAPAARHRRGDRRGDGARRRRAARSARARAAAAARRSPYTAAPFAAGFPGTLSVARRDRDRDSSLDLARELTRHGFARARDRQRPPRPRAPRRSPRAAPRAAKERLLADRLSRPDARSRGRGRLTEEFRSGACHAGPLEGSIVLAERPDLVREESRRELAPNPASLSTAIRDGDAHVRGGRRAARLLRLARRRDRRGRARHDRDARRDPRRRGRAKLRAEDGPA